MPLRTWLPALCLTVAMPVTWAAQAATMQVIELSDGGQIVLRADGALRRYDASGAPIAMPERSVMTTKDGTRIMVQGASLWRETFELATTDFALASTLPWSRSEAGRRVIDLKGGGRIELQVDGITFCYDAAGNRVRMADGDAMTAADGTVILMNNGTLWTPRAGAGATRSTR
jgi:hypothetical protein